MPSANGRQKHFSQLPGVEFGGVIFRAEITQCVAHHFAGIGVAAGFARAALSTSGREKGKLLSIYFRT
jgi:hypothetical protein